MYDTPTLWVQPGPTVTSGENVTFYCRLETVTNTFFLLREGGPSHPQGSHGAVPAEFPVGPVTSAHTGTYRCFGAYSGHVWSFPSEPVKLLVTGEEAPSSQVLPGLLKKPQGPVEGTSTPEGQGRRMEGAEEAPSPDLSSSSPSPDVGDPSLEPTDPAAAAGE